LKLFIILHFAYVVNVLFDVEGGDLQLMLLVSVYVWPADDPNLGSKLDAT